MHRWNGTASETRFPAILKTFAVMAFLAAACVQPASAQGTITSVSPASVGEGNPQFNLQVTVSNLPVSSGYTYQIIWSFDDSVITLPATLVSISPSVVQATIPASNVQIADTVYLQVQTFISGYNSVPTQSYPFTITGPNITSLQPSSTVVGSPAFTLTINGNGFSVIDSVTPTVYFGSGSSDALPSTYISNTQLQVTVPASYLKTVGVVPVSVIDADGSTSSASPFSVTAVVTPPPPPPPPSLPLTILTPLLPPSQVNTPYDFTIQTANGVSPLTFTATGLPSTVTLNPSSGELKGTPTQVANYQVSLTVKDSSGQVASIGYYLDIYAPVVVPLQFSTASLPQGQVGVSYTGSIGATGGTSPYTFGLTAGSALLPAGLSLASNGAINGTPTTAGTSTFTVLLTDSAGGSVSQNFTLTVVPPPLTVSTTQLASPPAGTPITLNFAATGGYPPYTFSATGSVPPGTSVGSNGALTGTPSAAGSYTFTVIVKDSSGATASKTFTLTVVPPLLTILTASLPNGQVGVPYSVQFYAANRQPPYSWTVSGAPAGVTMSSTGLLSGTPTADGPFAVAVTVTDAVNDQAQQTYNIAILAAPLLITTQALPAGVAGSPYTATLSATGGDAPYTWTFQGLPAGITSSPAGALSGAPAASGSSSVAVTVTDSKGVKATATFTLAVTPVPINVTTTSLPNGTVQAPYSATVAASGGAGSNKWTASGLPPGLAMSATGTISGSPTAPGLFVVVVTVTDAAGTIGVQTLSVSVLLPVTPPLTFGNLPSTVPPATQSNLQVSLASPYPLPVTVTLTMTFTPTSGPDDPAVQFASGGRVTVIQIPASSSGGNPVIVAAPPVQFGTVAGAITITADMQSAGQDITPTPAPTQTVQIAAAAPSIASVTAIRGSGGFTVTVIGFATPRSVTQAAFTFAAASSANLQTGSLTVPVASLFSSWYSSSASAPFGSQFSFVQPFTVTGSVQGITTVTVTLTDAQGNSTPVTATLQ